MEIYVVWRALCCVAVLAGCSTVELTPPPPVTLPDAWQGAGVLGTAPKDVGWLDPQLMALQNRALIANRSIAQAALRWLQARRRVTTNEARLAPTLGIDASRSRELQKTSSSRAFQVGGGDVLVPTNTGEGRSFSASVSASFEWDLWSRLAHSDSAVAAQAEAANVDIAAARALIQTQVAEHYWTAATSIAQQPSAKEQLSISQEILKIIALRVSEGKLAPIEIDKAISTLSIDQVRISDLVAEEQQERHELALLLDLALPGPDLKTARLPSTAPPRWAMGAPTEALATRPDVQRARLEVDAALARLRGAQANRYPRLSFSAALGSNASEAHNWFNLPLLSLGANLFVPMINWRDLEIQRDNALTDLELAALSLREVVNKSLVEVEAQLIERRRLQAHAAVLDARVSELLRAERMAELKYHEGMLSRLDWLQARHARLAGEQECQQMELRRWLNYTAMFRILGVEIVQSSSAP